MKAKLAILTIVVLVLAAFKGYGADGNVEALGMFEAALPGLRALHSDQYDTPHKLEKAYKSFRQNLALSEVARKRGYADTPDMRGRIAQMLAQELILKEAETARPVHSITEEEVRAFFEDHKAEYVVPAMLGAQEIVLRLDFRSSTQREVQLTLATNIIRLLGTGIVDMATFMAVARTNSDPKFLQGNGGHLGIFPSRPYRGQQPALTQDAIEALLKLRVIGHITGPIIGISEIRILRLSAFREATIPDYKALKEPIRYRLYMQAREDRIQQLASESGWDLKRGLDTEVITRLLSQPNPNIQGSSELPPTPTNFGIPVPEPSNSKATK